MSIRTIRPDKRVLLGAVVAVGLAIPLATAPSGVVSPPAEAACNNVGTWQSRPAVVRVGVSYYPHIVIKCGGSPVSVKHYWADLGSDGRAYYATAWVSSSIGNARPTMVANGPVGNHRISVTYAPVATYVVNR